MVTNQDTADYGIPPPLSFTSPLLSPNPFISRMFCENPRIYFAITTNGQTFFIIFTTLQVSTNTLYSTVEYYVNDKVERIWKEAVMA